LIDNEACGPYEARPMASGGLSAEEQQRFDQSLSEILTHYPADRKSAAMLPALRLMQSLKGWLSPDAMRLVAERLGVPKERAYEVATFYVMFHTQKPGTYVVDVCTNLSCSLRGAEGLMSYLERKLGVKAGDTTEKWSLRETECLASCGTAPCLQVNEDHHESLTREKVDQLFDALP
jgi:NADH-quinone oxidoreductase subunit E